MSASGAAAPTTRAALRVIEPATSKPCAHCGVYITYTTRNRQRAQVIANVYEDGRWDRVEHYHEKCYRDAGEPHGPPLPVRAGRVRRPGEVSEKRS